MSTGEVVSPITDMSAHRRRFAGLPPTPDRNRVRRSLFGPVDHQENRRFLDRELERISRRDSQLYNFDFQRGVPLAGFYDWKPVKRVHSSYALRGLPYCSQHADDSSIAVPSTSRDDATQSSMQTPDPPSTATSSVSTSSCSSNSSSSSSSSSNGSASLVSTEPSTAEIPDRATYTPRSLRQSTNTSREEANDSRIRTRQSVMTEFLKQRKRAAPVSKVTSPSPTPSSGPTKSKVPKTSSS